MSYTSETLAQIDSEEIAFVHIDMNCAPPEIAAIEYLWPRLTTGAMVLLDDYAYIGYHHQKNAMDKFANSKSVDIMSLPTGQGLLVKPPEKQSNTLLKTFLAGVNRFRK